MPEVFFAFRQCQDAVRLVRSCFLFCPECAQPVLVCPDSRGAGRQDVDAETDGSMRFCCLALSGYTLARRVHPLVRSSDGSDVYDVR
jgi:hypothetical protein